MTEVKTTLMDAASMARTLTRLAHEILERHQNLSRLALVGLHTRGAYLARRLLKLVRSQSDDAVKFGSVDVTFHRDDFRSRLPAPQVRSSDIPFAVDDMNIILVDDVLYTGRTIRAAMNSVMDFGRPAIIQVAVLVDRGHRELPIKADYVGKNYPTSVNEHIHVHVSEVDGLDEVLLVRHDQ